MVVYPTYPEQLIIVRHAQSLLNVSQAKSPSFFATAADRAPFIGIPDHSVGLSEKGIRQARATGVAFRKNNVTFSDVLDTGYERTVRTLDHILEAYTEQEQGAMRRQHDISLRERETGYTYCLTKPEAATHFPWMEEYWKTFGPVFAKPMGGESIAGTIDRVRMALFHTFVACQGKSVLCCVHGRVITAMRYLLDDCSLEQLEQYLPSGAHHNCGVTVYKYSSRDRRLVLHEANVCYWED